MSKPLWPRLRWHLYRTPAARLLKSVLRVQHGGPISARRKLAQSLPTTGREAELARQVNANGYAIVTDAMDPDALQALSLAGAEKLRRAHTGQASATSNHKSFWLRLLDEDMVDSTLPTDNPFVQFAIQPQVIRILSKVFGEVPYLDYVLLTLSRDTGKPLAYSQLWHKDHDDVRVVKLFVYLTDVEGPADGPFTFIPGPDSDRVGFSLRSHRPDQAIESAIGLEKVTALVQPRLSTFIVETSRCLHMGSRLFPGHERLLYTATYFAIPRLFPEPPPRFRLSGTESAEQLHLLKLSES